MNAINPTIAYTFVGQTKTGDTPAKTFVSGLHHDITLLFTSDFSEYSSPDSEFRGQPTLRGHNHRLDFMRSPDAIKNE